MTFEFVKLPSTSFHFILKQEWFCTVYLHSILYSKQFKNTSFFARMDLSLVGSISLCPTSKKSTGIRDIHKQDDIKKKIKAQYLGRPLANNAQGAKTDMGRTERRKWFMKDPLITIYILCKFNFFNDFRFCIFLCDPGLKGLATYPCEKTRLIKIWSLDFTVSEQHWTERC